MDVSELGEEAWAAALHPARWPAALLGTLARLSRLFVPRVLCMRTHRGASPQELGVPRRQPACSRLEGFTVLAINSLFVFLLCPHVPRFC